MIARLKGTIEEKSKDRLILDVNGVGYGLHVPERILLSMPELGATTTVHVYTHVREDQISLFGFSSKLEQDVFEILLSANGVGPKLALTILSALDAEQVLEAVAHGNKAMFDGISGVGKKTVEKLLIEIREKCEKRLLLERGADLSMGKRGTSASVKLLVGGASWSTDLEQALVALGYKENDVRPVLREAVKRAEHLRDFQEALKYALSLLNGNGNSKRIRGTA